MRRLFRPPLEYTLGNYLDRMQDLVDSSGGVAPLWKAQRKTSPMRQIAQVLGKMTGPRERCMYCEDSRGTDIEHFRPQSRYPNYAFRWLNFLWICTACNRSKGNRFPLDAAGNPLLIDPTLDDPWDFLFFDPKTGEITARWDSTTSEEHPKGQTILETLSPLRHQAVTEGRRRTFLRLQRAVRSFLGDGNEEVSEASVQDLLDCVDDAVEYGIAVWFFVRDGQDEEPFRALRTRFPKVWDRAVKRLTTFLAGVS
jgi:uncharacterized protein (TIGR02646 family)